MNSENRPANSGPKNNRNRRKPYYMKKKPHNEGDEQKKISPEEQAQKNEQVKAESPKSEQPKAEQKKSEQPSAEKAHGEQQRSEQNHSHHNNRRNRQRDNRHRDSASAHVEKDAAQDISVKEETFTEPTPIADPETVFEANGDDMTPEVVVNIMTAEEDEKTVTVTGVRFKPGGKVYFFDKGEFEPKTGSHVIVETARGLEFGEVAFGSRNARESSLVLPLRPIVRIATEEDLAHHKENKKKEEEAFGICLEKIKKHGLDMKLIEAQFSFDNSKLLFYFTSASRVDFRELVKDLASVFKTRIELRQIGIRDEAKIMGGLGVCGRSLCCSTFLSDFVQVSIKMAKEQNLSLNSGKISGCCGRLMCCLQYEYKTYAEETAKTPPVDSLVKTRDGMGFITEINPLAATVKVKLKDKPDTPPVLFKRDEVTVISKGRREEEEDS